MKIGNLFKKLRTTATTIPSGYGLVQDVLTGQTAPTTSTEGYLGQVMFDTDGNRWELKLIEAGLCYWALPDDCFPANGTKYFHNYCNGVKQWKKRIVGDLPASGSSVSVAMGESNINVFKVNAYVFSTFCIFSPFYSSATYKFQVRPDNTNLTIDYGSTVTFYSKPYSVSIYFTEEA